MHKVAQSGLERGLHKFVKWYGVLIRLGVARASLQTLINWLAPDLPSQSFTTPFSKQLARKLKLSQNITRK